MVLNDKTVLSSLETKVLNLEKTLKTVSDSLSQMVNSNSNVFEKVSNLLSEHSDKPGNDNFSTRLAPIEEALNTLNDRLPSTWSQIVQTRDCNTIQNRLHNADDEFANGAVVYNIDNNIHEQHAINHMVGSHNIAK